MHNYVLAARCAAVLSMGSPSLSHIHNTRTVHNINLCWQCPMYYLYEGIYYVHCDNRIIFMIFTAVAVVVVVVVFFVVAVVIECCS